MYLVPDHWLKCLYNQQVYVSNLLRELFPVGFALWPLAPVPTLTQYVYSLGFPGNMVLYPTLYNLLEEGARCSVTAGSESNWAPQVSSVGSGGPPSSFHNIDKARWQVAPCPLSHLGVSS